MRFRIHPLFFALALLLVLFGQASALLWTFAAVAVHEAGHALAARARAYTVRELTLFPYGAAMGMGEEMDPKSCVIVGAAGPFANLLAAAGVLALWWLVPAAYPFTYGFLRANLFIALFNLLPVYPLDGSRIVGGLAKGSLKAVSRMRRAGIVLSVLLFVLFVVSFFLKAVSFTLGVTAVFLFAGAALDGGRATYVSVLSPGRKNYLAGVVERAVTVSRDTPLGRLFHYVDGRSVTSFRVVEEGGEGEPPRELFRMDERALRDAALSGSLTRTVGEAVSSDEASAVRQGRKTGGGRRGPAQG